MSIRYIAGRGRGGSRSSHGAEDAKTIHTRSDEVQDPTYDGVSIQGSASVDLRRTPYHAPIVVDSGTVARVKQPGMCQPSGRGMTGIIRPSIIPIASAVCSTALH